MKRPKKFTLSFTGILKDLWTHIYGIITLISFIAALWFTISTLNNENVTFKDTLYVCLGVITVLCFVIVRISLKYSQMQEMGANLMNYERENNDLITLIQLQSETTHNIIHYYRSLMLRVDAMIHELDKEAKIDQKLLDELLDDNKHFLIMFTSSLQNYFSIYTDDNCSISIKLLDKNGKRIRTLFRDPVNLKKRRMAELSNIRDTYSASNNTAFETILNKNKKDYYFASDNLKDLYERHLYTNCNHSWNNFYNATVVTPISRNNNKEDIRHVLGFLTVDNKNGYLVDNSTIEYMFGMSDLLYFYLFRIDQMLELLSKTEYDYGKAKEFTFRNDNQ